METGDKSERFSSRSGKSFAGLILVVIGGVLLGRELGFDIPNWVFSWWTLIVAIGLFIGAKRTFRPGPWMLFVFVGVAFLIDEYYGELSFHHYIWPMAIILLGLWMILKPRKQRKWNFDQSNTTDSTIDINTVFGGTKKMVVSKDFKGGEINTVFGGNDIDFSQADFSGTASLEINVVFGGVKLIVPPHWKIQSDVTAAFGSVEDKRREAGQVSENKTLVLKGSVAFGGIEIKSY